MRWDNLSRLPDDWHRRSFAQKLAFTASLTCGSERPPESHREWLYHLSENPNDHRVAALYKVATHFGDPISSPSSDVAFSEAAVRMYTHARWVDYGCQSFQLSDSLAALLSLTEAHSAYENIQFPFPAFLLEVPPGYITAETADPVRLLVHRYMVLQECTMAEGPEEDRLRIEIYSDDNLDVLHKRMSELATELDSSRIVMTFDENNELVESTDQSTRRKFATALNLVCNFALWLQAAPNWQRTQSEKRKQDNKRVGPWPTTWFLGREVKLDREMRDLAREVVLHPKKRNSGWKLRIQKLVRGHWKHQPYGPGRTLRKLIHVEPYLRGPDGDSAWTSIYKATGREK